jgi:putative ABC transport system permease protein
MGFGPIFRSLLRNRARVVLIVAEVALTLAIVANCLGLILDTRARLAQPSGFDDEHLISIYSTPFDDRLRDPKQLSRLVDQDRRALAAVAGVRAASETSLRPWESSGSSTDVHLPGTHDEPVQIQIAQADPGLFATLGLPVAQGRGFTIAEYEHGADAPLDEVLPAVVSRALANRLYPHGGAVGKLIAQADESQRFLIVGILDGFYNPFNHADRKIMLTPGRSARFAFGSHYLVRTRGNPGPLLPQLEKALLAVDKGRLVRLRTMVQDRDDYHGRDRLLIASLDAVMALLVLVTALGIVGLTSFSVAERQRQIGTRRALGADRPAIVRHFLLENWMLTTCGVVLGTALAYGLNFGLVTWVAGAKLSPATVAAGAVALWTIGLGAALGPALRGARVPPAIATRNV